MKYKAYPKYKDSGTNWLTDVPKHWGIYRTKTLFRLFNGYAFKSEYFSKTESSSPRLVTPGNFHQDGGLYFNDDNTNYFTGEVKPEFRLKRGDQLIVMTDLSYKKLILGNSEFVFDDDLLLNQRVAKLLIHPNYIKQIDREFLRYLLNSSNLREQLISTTTGATVFHSSPEKIGNLLGTLPPLDEQRSISKFLNSSTKDIDTLILKKQRLIDLLQEKRQALISHAVTKGLNPKAKMKDSDIEWLGMIPEHWEVKKGKYLGTLIGCPAIEDSELTEDPEDGDIRFLKVDDLNNPDGGIFLGSSRYRLRRTSTCGRLASNNCLIFPKRGAAIFTNKVRIIIHPTLFDSNLMGWKIFTKFSIKFVAYSLLLRRLNDLADVSTVPQINNKHIAPEPFPVPPIKEQEDIVQFIESKSSHIDALVDKLKLHISRLQEYRQALISAAVTGKIDVRGVL